MYLPDLGRRTVSSSTRTAALTAAVFLVVVSAVAFGSSSVRTVPVAAFMPIVVTFWFCAESLTALLLFGQYYVTGSTGFAIFACAYEFSALLAVPYLFASPGVLPGAPPTQVDYQPHVWLWSVWHLAFPVLIVIGFALDPLLKRRVGSRREVGASLAFVAIATLVAAVVVTLVVWSARDSLADLVANAHPTALFRFAIAPAVTLANVAACVFVFVRGKSATSLGMWLALATFAAALEGIISAFSDHTFSLAWYLAKVETTLTASLVLAMLLIEIGLLYGKLTDLATRDALTGLHNRRGLEEYLQWAYDYASRRELGLALLVVDIDHFKRYNDRYGHATGDVALRRVASLLRKSAVRRYDLVARYGGEEFVVALFNVGPHQAAVVAERLKERIGDAKIPHAAVDSGRLSVSIGVGQVGDAAHATIDELFAVADRALYQAKAAGRDRYMLATID